MSPYEIEESLQELEVQERILNTAVDIQALLRLFLNKGLITREEVNEYRDEVKNSGKYKVTLERIQKQKLGFQTAKDNPEDYLKALFNAKMNGDIK